MISENPVFAILVTSGNQALAAPGTKVTELKVGQLGIFDYKTNLAIDGVDLVAGKEQVYYAVGKGPGAPGSAATDIKKSAGNAIQKKAIRAFEIKQYKPAKNQKFNLTFTDIIPEKEYSVKFQVQNQEAYANYGYNVPTKAFALRGGPEANPDSGLADTNDFVKQLVDYINLDDEKVLKATMLDGSTPVTAENYATWKANAGNEDKVLTVEVEVNPMAYKNFNGINLNYASNLATVVVPSLVDFGNNATVTETQKVTFEDMSGKTVKQLEYESGGWEGNPGIYRQSEAQGLMSFESQADTSKGYSTVTVTYENAGIGGGEVYHSSLQTIIATPSTDGTTFDDLTEVFNRVYLGTEPAGLG